MAEHDATKSPNATPNAGGSADLLSLDAATAAPLDSGNGASSADSILNAAEMFQQQLEQMTAWKHQLAEQMEMMRRDGVKLLERQKTLAQEKKRISDEKEALAADRARIQELQSQAEAETRRLAERAAQVAASEAELQKLQAERAQWESQLAAARGEIDSIAMQKAQAASETAAAEARLAQAEARLAAIQQEQQSLDAARHEHEIRTAELQARQKALADQEAHCLAQDVRLKEAFEQLEQQRRQLSDAQRSTSHDRESLASLQQQLAARESELSRLASELASRDQASAQKVAATESDLQARLAEAETLRAQAAEDRQAALKARQELQKKLESLETEQAEQLESLARQTKRLSERRAQIEAAERDLDKALQDRIAQATAAVQAELAAAQSAYSQKAAAWEQKAATAESEAATLRQAQTDLSAQLAQAQSKLTALQTAQDELEFKLELAAEDHRKALESTQAQLTREITSRDEQIASLQQKYQEALAASASKAKGGDGNSQELARKLASLEQERDELARQLFTIQDSIQRQQEEAILNRNVLEGRILTLEQQNAALEAEKSAWHSHAPLGAAPPASPAGQSIESIAELAQAQQQLARQRERLLRRAKALRGYRQQSAEARAAMEAGRAEIAQQREQVRARKENLEQVKRLLEKQEMVMARKLADHNAIKTVAAVGIFVIMILGSAFFGVYRFVAPVYRSEAVVQLAPPPELQGLEAEAWLSRQMEFIRSNDVSYAAWKVLRSADEHYAMHDVRDEWLGSLNKHLNMQLDSASKTVAIRYSGPDATGVSQVCNALASAYTQPTLREPTEQTKDIGAGAQVLAKATPPLYPAEDHRLMIAMSVVAVVLFVSLLLVMTFRHFVARQLKEIDQMADARDLDDIHSDLPENAPRPAGT